MNENVNDGDDAKQKAGDAMDAQRMRANALEAITSLGIIRDGLQGRWRPTAEAIEALAQLLSDLSPNQVRSACRMYAMQSDRAPCAADIRRLACAPEFCFDDVSAEEDFAHLVARANQVPYGTDQATLDLAEQKWAYDHPPRRAGVQALGGFRTLLALRTSERANERMNAARSAFCRAYEAARSRHRRELLIRANSLQRAAGGREASNPVNPPEHFLVDRLGKAALEGKTRERIRRDIDG